MTSPLITAATDTTLDLYRENQTAHGLTANQAIYFNGTSWVVAQSNAVGTFATDIVAEVTDVDNFRRALPGETVAGYTGLTAGQVATVSAATAGAVVSVAQGTVAAGAAGQNPIGQAVSTTEVRFYPYIAVAS